MDLHANQFLQAATVAVENIPVRKAVQKSTTTVNQRRDAAMSGVTDAQALRQQGRGGKLRALEDLPELLEQMERNVTAHGGQVLWAADAVEANRHVIDICQKHHLKLGVKSKSMVTEEIGLLDALADIGVEMVETDLGEFIAQISGDHPSHIIMPIMHKSKDAIRDIFIDTLDMPYTDDAQDMTLFVRRYLRQKYLEADFGMSGGNFLIAETGTVVIVTNEGNGRLSTSLPPVHIAIVGIEKIVPTWEDFTTLLQMLPRTGTGQSMGVYVTLFNGPARADDSDGPEHFYLILVDNGRSEAYASEYAEALACVRCGACLNACPVYRSVGGHTYGSVYSGPIGSVFTPVTQGKENAALLPFASSLCGACKQACPVDINIPDMLLRLRRDLQSQQEPIWKLGLKTYAFGSSHPLLFQMGGKAASLATRALASASGSDHLDTLPYPLNGWTDKRDFPPFAPESFHEWWAKNRGKAG
jgi:L-lactate dehydrogenase complex protein LldF